MKIFITGASGFIGSHLVTFLKEQGHHVVVISREKKESTLYWNPEKKEIDLTPLEKADALIHLSGENIASGRWSKEKKEKIRTSRVQSTQFLAESLAKLQTPPRVWINASAIGFYGDVKDREVSESSPKGSGFLSDVCKEWEEAMHGALHLNTRLVQLRTGLVLSKEGGALKRMLLPFKLFLGGVLGDGTQEVSWIDIDDLSRIFLYVIENEIFRGPVNAVSPFPVTNREFTAILAKVLHRKAFLPMPKPLVSFLFGEMGEELLLHGAEVRPEKLLNAHFTYLYPTLEQSLRHQV